MLLPSLTLLAGHTELNAPLPTSASRDLPQCPERGHVQNGKLQNVHLPRDQVHGRHGLPKSQGNILLMAKTGDITVLESRHLSSFFYYKFLSKNDYI